MALFKSGRLSQIANWTYRQSYKVKVKLHKDKATKLGSALTKCKEI